MPSAYDLPKLFRALRYGNGPWYRRALPGDDPLPGRNAKRAHPERDAEQDALDWDFKRSSNFLINNRLQTIVSKPVAA